MYLTDCIRMYFNFTLQKPIGGITKRLDTHASVQSITNKCCSDSGSYLVVYILGHTI